MRVLYCENCGSRIGDDEIAPGGAVAHSSNQIYCSRCAPSFPKAARNTPSALHQIKPTSSGYGLPSRATGQPLKPHLLKGGKAAGTSKTQRRDASKPFPVVMTSVYLAGGLLLVLLAYASGLFDSKNLQEPRSVNRSQRRLPL